MKILLFLPFILAGLSLLGADDNEITKASVKGYEGAVDFLIGELNKQREKFCKAPDISSALTAKGSIRASSGKFCATLLGAALAKEVCATGSNVDDFGNSQCKGKMDKALKADLVDSILESDKATFTWKEGKGDAKIALAFIIKQRGAEKVCAAIDNYYNMGKSACKSGINQKIPKK